MVIIIGFGELGIYFLFLWLGGWWGGGGGAAAERKVEISGRLFSVDLKLIRYLAS